MRLDPRLRASLYALTAVLFVTGAGWWILDWFDALPASSTWRQTGAYLLMVHGGAAMLILLLLGALITVHVRATWPSGASRGTGVLMLASNALLIVTAFGLYYIGREGLRHWAGTLHVALGFGFPVVLAIHVFRGRRHHAEQVTPSTSITLGPPRRDGSAANPKAATSRWPSP